MNCYKKRSQAKYCMLGNSDDYAKYDSTIQKDIIKVQFIRVSTEKDSSLCFEPQQ